MEMEDQYGITDLRQYMTGGRSNFPAIPTPGDIFSGHRHHYEMVMVGGGEQMVSSGGGVHHHHHHNDFRSDSTTTASVGLEMEGGGGDGGNGRWPRQETLTLLEIRSRLDSKFKEANQKGPLWDEVSRILYEEHGYQRSGKKCREKFENLYKYYKKTKEGKAGRQDGKHYRFFRQLEALYGDSSNPISFSENHLVGNSYQFHNTSNINSKANQEVFQAPKLSESLSLSNSSEFNTASSDEYNDEDDDDDDNDDSAEKKKKRRGRRSWKSKIREFIDSRVRKLMEKQEEWLEKMVKTIESKEQERMLREEEWRKQEVIRIEREHKFWANERAWIEARDAALMDALKKFAGKGVFKASSSSEELIGAELQQSPSENQIENGSETIITKECNKKRKENSIRRSCYFENNESIYNQGGLLLSEMTRVAPNDDASPPSSNAHGNGMHESCFRFLGGGDHGDNLWENYCVKLSKGENH